MFGMEPVTRVGVTVTFLRMDRPPVDPAPALPIASQVLSSAQSLSSESNHLKTEVQKFLATVRAA